MKYYVVDCISGCRTGAKAYSNLDDAKARRDKLDVKAMKEGHSKGFWIIIDESGKEVTTE